MSIIHHISKPKWNLPGLWGGAHCLLGRNVSGGTFSAGVHYRPDLFCSLGSFHAIMLLTGWLECQRLPLRFLWPSHLKVKCYGWVIIFQFYQSLWSQSSCDRKWKLCKWREMPKISSHNRKLSSREIEFGQKITWASISSTEGGNDFG